MAKDEGRWSYTINKSIDDDVLMGWENLNGEEDISKDFLAKLKNNVGIYRDAVNQGEYNSKRLDWMENVLDVTFNRVQTILGGHFGRTEYGNLNRQYELSKKQKVKSPLQPQPQS